MKKLREHSQVPSGYKLEAADAITWAATNLPYLTANGWRERGEAPDLPLRLVLDEVGTALMFLDGSGVRIQKTINRRISSYGWKHHAERWGRLLGFSPYISNGAFIAAAMWRNVPMKMVDDGPNCVFGLSQPSRTDWLRSGSTGQQPNQATIKQPSSNGEQ